MCTVRTFIKFNQQKVSLFSFRHLIKRTKTETNELHITSNCQDFNNSLAGTFCICLTNIWATNSKFLPISDCSRAVRCWSFDLEHLSLLSSRKHRESSVPLCSGSWAWVIGVLLPLRCCNGILLSTRTRTLVFLFLTPERRDGVYTILIYLRRCWVSTCLSSLSPTHWILPKRHQKGVGCVHNYDFIWARICS